MNNILPPLSLYVHLPWCIRKCPYCDFNSHKAGDAPPRDRYIAALINDLKSESEAGRNATRQVETVFIGGGTPSLFSADEIADILEAVGSHLNLDVDAEITMEANPGAVEYGSLAGYRQAGVNRLSLGAQSFSADSLNRLGRIHGPAEIVCAYEGARSAGFDNINLDLMFGLPGQDVDAAMYDIHQALALLPDHLSWYQLTLEPNTVFYQRPPENLPDHETCWEISDAGLEQLDRAGYEHYEVSAFAQAGRRCRHNLNYWTFGDYLAVGAGAHGKITTDDGSILRYRKPAHPAAYIEQGEAGSFDDHLESVAPPDIAFEYMLNALRLPHGFRLSDFSSRTGLPPNTLAAVLEDAQSDGLMRTDGGGHWRATELGSRFLNDLQARFLPEQVSD